MCECEEGKCNCSNECNEKSSECCCNGEYDKVDMFLYMAKQSKMELLKEKMKKRLEASHGKKLDRIAELIVEELVDQYKTEDDISRKRQELSKKLENMFQED